MSEPERPRLAWGKKQELMSAYRVVNRVVVETFLQHSRDEQNAIEQLQELQFNCPQFFRK